MQSPAHWYTLKKPEIIGDLCCGLRPRNPQSLSLHCERSVCLQAAKCRAALHLVHGVGAILGGQEGSLSVLLTMEKWCSIRAAAINTFFFYFYMHSLEEKNLLLFFWKAQRMLFLAVLHLRCCLTRSCVIALFSDFTRSTGREMSLQQGTIPVFLYFFCQWALPQQASRCISGTQIQHQHHITGGCLKPFYLSVARVRDPGSSSIDGGFQFLPWSPWQPVQKPSPKTNATQWEQRHQVCIFLWGIVLNVLCYSDNFRASCKKQKPRTN